MDASAGRVEAFTRKQVSGSKGSLTTAQFVIARAHGFASWPKFAGHLKSLQDRASTVAAFEAAAVAVVNGDAEHSVACCTRIRAWCMRVPRASTARPFFTTCRRTASKAIGSGRPTTAARSPRC